jgi:Raf kinase inhibitor-like YbhB/YbcL family protein
MVLLDVPASVTELATGAVTGDQSGLPAGAFCVRNDYGSKDFGGAAPPAGDPPHRYVFAVHALDADSLGVNSDVSPAVAGFNVGFHTLARAVMIPVYGH